MKFASPQQFLNWEHKAITLMGMSGVGKSTLANKLPKSAWFHYSADYRIGTRYLGEPILDNIKKYAMQDPFLADLLRSDSIYIANNISVENLAPLSTFLGKLGATGRGGVPLDEFKRRQRLHREAEIQAMNDVEAFMVKAYDIYGYHHFINDASGSLCELDHPPTLERLAERTLILYIQTDHALEELLTQRAIAHPKPLYYQEAFLDQQLERYLAEHRLQGVSDIDPDHFVRWVFPHLLYHRLPKYQAIADRYGYSIPYRDIAAVRDERDFLDLVSERVATVTA